MTWTGAGALVAWSLASACTSASAPSTDAPLAGGVPAALRTAPAAKPLPEGQPGLVVLNTTEVDIDLYTATVVDRAGRLGSRVLWPHKHDCEDQARSRVVPRSGGRFTLPPPSRTFAPGECEPGPPLPPGEYVVRVDSGYATELHATATVTLPMTAPVELRLERHVGAVPCTDALAQRAFTLTAAEVGRARSLPSVPKDILDGCDGARARCVASGEPPPLPPAACEVTLWTGEYAGILRVSRPAGRDAPRGLTAELDHDVVYSRFPHATRSSSSVYEHDGRALVIAGEDSEHWHEHGGDAARVGYVTLRVHNPFEREVPFTVAGLEFLRSFSCEPPSEVKARPVVRAVDPPRALPPGESALTISFEAQEAYQGHCDRFATRARIVVFGVERGVTSEHNVGRFDPID